MEGILGIVYILASWWAINKVWYSKHQYIVFNTAYVYGKKFALAFFLGWLLIPVAILMTIMEK